jgi:hypothetical protein
VKRRKVEFKQKQQLFKSRPTLTNQTILQRVCTMNGNGPCLISSKHSTLFRLKNNAMKQYDINTLCYIYIFRDGKRVEFTVHLLILAEQYISRIQPFALGQWNACARVAVTVTGKNMKLMNRC